MANPPISSPLPADLPTNWVYGQTVAPNGSDAGLSEKHGYNYQSQQINAAQTAINTINNAFSGLATTADFNQSAPLNSPSFTGTPTAPTAEAGTNTTQIATTAFVTSVAAKIPQFVYGSFNSPEYTFPDGSYNKINLGFKPTLVMCFGHTGQYWRSQMAIAGYNSGSITITDSGFETRALYISENPYTYLAMR